MCVRVNNTGYSVVDHKNANNDNEVSQTMYNDINSLLSISSLAFSSWLTFLHHLKCTFTTTQK